MLLLLSALACRTATCEKGFELREDGLCYQILSTETGEDADTGAPTGEDTDTGAAETGDTGGGAETAESGETGAVVEDEPTTLDDVLDDLEPCAPISGDGSLDLEGHCVDGLCVGDSVSDAFATFGTPDATSLYTITYEGYVFTYVSHLWANGISASYDDEDADGVLNPGDRVISLTVELPYSGGTMDGLGLGANIACFLDEIGDPDQVEFWPTGDAYRVSYVWWSRADLSIGDTSLNGTGEFGISDGLVDSINL